MKTIFFIFCSFCPFVLPAQVFKIISQIEKSPVPHAHIFCSGENVLVSDARGIFFADSSICSEFEITAVGFKKQKFRYSDAIKNGNCLFLLPDTLFFPETEIFSEDYIRALRKKIKKNFNRNYSGIPYRAEGIFESETHLDGAKTDKTVNFVYHSEGENEKMLADKFRYLAFDWAKFENSAFEHERMSLNSFFLTKKRIFFAVFFDKNIIFSEPKTVNLNGKSGIKLNFKYFENDIPSEGSIWVNTQNYAVERIEHRESTTASAQKFGNKNENARVKKETRTLQIHFVKAGTHYRLGNFFAEIAQDLENEKNEILQKKTRLSFGIKKYSQEILNEEMIKTLYPELMLVGFSGFYYDGGRVR